MKKAKSSNESALLLVMIVAGALVAIQQTVVVPLLPEFTRILETSADNVSWLVTITLLTSSTFVPIVTRMADMYGKRLMLLISISLMLIGSLVAMSTTSLAIMILGRGIQGMSMGIIPIGISILRERMPPKRVATSIAIMSATMGIGGSIALPIAGGLYRVFGWQSVFLMVAAVSTLLFILTLLLLPESKIRTGGKFDLLGATLLAISLSALLLLISKGNSLGFTSPAALGLFVSVLIFALLWLYSQTKSKNPIVDLKTLRHKPVAYTNMYSLFVGFAMMANSLLVTFQLQMPTSTGYGHGLDVFTATLYMLPGGIAMAALSPVSGSLINRLGSRFVLIIGASIMTVGYISLFTWHSSPLALVVGSTIITSGIAFAYAAQPTMIMDNVPESEIAASNGINSLLRSMGTSLASATSAGLLAAFVIPSMVGDLPSWTGFGITYAIAIACGMAAVALAFLLPRRATVVQ
ncbi:MAG TPA: MFS transporter [Microbacteriaceae bacterium]|nr:MFS transporter [Microbacteriaceae bacterium]